MYGNEATLLKTSEEKYSSAQSQIFALSNENSSQRIEIQSQTEQINDLKRQKEALELMLKESVAALESSQSVNSALDSKLKGYHDNRAEETPNSGPQVKSNPISESKSRPVSSLSAPSEVAVSSAGPSIRLAAKRLEQSPAMAEDSASAQVINAFMQKIKIWNKRLDEIDGESGNSVN